MAHIKNMANPQRETERHMAVMAAAIARNGGGRKKKSCLIAKNGKQLKMSMKMDFFAFFVYNVEK